MKLAVEFPSVAYREGADGVVRLARAIEQIGYDHIDMFDHVVMGFPIDGRPPGPYNPAMPILEALVTLSHVAAVTSRVTLGTEVLVLPQRQPTLVAKQVSTLDTLSGGRVRLGVGVGWQEPEYEALGEDFHTRGARMDEAIAVLRACWGDAQVDVSEKHYRLVAMGMEPKPPQGRRLPIWIGGRSEAAYRRVGRLGDGWLAGGMPDGSVRGLGVGHPASEAAYRRVGRLGDGWLAGGMPDAETTHRAVASIRRHAEAAHRDPDAIGLQSMVATPPKDPEGKRFYAEHDRVAARVAELRAMGFQGAALNATAIFQAGARSVGAMIDALGALHTKIRAEVG